MSEKLKPIFTSATQIKKGGLNQLENGEPIINMSILLAWPRAQRVQFAIMLIKLK